MQNNLPEYIYCVIAFNSSGKVSSLSGMFFDKAEAINQLTKDDDLHTVWEYYYEYACIEKYRLNSLGHPSVTKERELISWFKFETIEPFDKTQAGHYVPCVTPEWAQHTFGFL